MSSFFGGLQTADGEEAAPRNGPKWEVSLGPLSVGTNGFALKPQMKVGAKVGAFKADLGVGDVRDGLSFQAKAEAAVNVQTRGHSIRELHDSIHCKTPGFKEALETAKTITVKGANGFRTHICDAVGISLDRLDMALEGQRVKDPMHLKVSADVGIGAGLKVCLGWCNNEGFHMVGVGGGAKAVVGLKANIFAGKHYEKLLAKVILGISNFTFEYTFPLPSLAAVEAPPEVIPVPGGTAAATEKSKESKDEQHDDAAEQNKENKDKNQHNDGEEEEDEEEKEEHKDEEEKPGKENIHPSTNETQAGHRDLLA
eukprot:CAMPEP_0206482770 /NCGR_PEP_ID=MMETSP0324_2-20121206/39048_1 /ASSEMBLY_ACC=CAM_ASM_000836 /TAXON_ID=2866 /ORGANISM="Crypthecodinium cohnii, Strain Seligo" /LENGTH=311 /DNA_ID=CAMNT_0053960733 /DNA_START=9 /DNA_END=944 /DNA_ORIENTATION=-